MLDQLEVLDIAARRSSGPPLVMLHEGLGSVSTWKDLPAALADRTGRRVVAYSRTGYGASTPAPLPRAPGYMHHEAETVLPALLHELSIEAPVLVGHSDGASIALIHAAGPAPVAAVVALAPHVFVEECTRTGAVMALTAYETGDLKTRLARHHRDVDNAFYGWNEIWLSERFRNWSIEDVLSKVTAPVLVIQCRDDPYGTTAQVDRIEAGVSGPFERLVFDSGGHAPQQAHPGRVTDATVDFVRRMAG